MAEAAILTINAGSSSLKFALYATTGDLARLGGGEVDRIGHAPRLRAARTGSATDETTLAAGAGQSDALDAVLAWIDEHFARTALAMVGHRVTHGGREFTAPVRVDDAILARLEALDSLVPLHQPYNLAAIRRLRERDPAVVQLACFDTAFHADWPDRARRFALPRALHDAGICRYGFHGLSYEYLAGRVRELAADAKRCVFAHLGNGASVCAVENGISRDCSFGFTALDGLPMGTRCGALDPGVVFHLLRSGEGTPDAVEQMLYRECGLLGVSGISADMRDLLASNALEAKQAVDLFTYHCSRQIAAMASALAGIDTLVFAGGIGENAPRVRAAACAPLAFLGVEIDAGANERGETNITAPNGRVQVLIVPTDEEVVIARHCRAALAA
jgi:acetate kinase